MTALALDRLVDALRAAAQGARDRLVPPPTDDALAHLFPPSAVRVARLSLDIPVGVEEVAGSRALALRVGPPPSRRKPLVLRIELDGDDLAARTTLDGHAI